MSFVQQQAARISEAAKILAETNNLDAMAFLNILDSAAQICVTQLGSHAPKDWLERLFPKSKPTTEADFEEAANRA